MSEAKVHTIDPSEIILNKDRPRQRKDLGEIKKMVKSIETYGQLQPIVITRNKELVLGGRRLAACILGQFQAKVCYSDEVDPLILQEMELEENVQRKNLTPAEESLAIDNLVKYRQARLGKPVQGREGGYTLENAASDIGKTKGTVIEAMNIAEMLRSFPSLSEAKTKSEIKSAFKGLERVASNITALSNFEKLTKTNKNFVIDNANALEHMTTVEDNSIDLLLTDPPYGIDIHNLAMTVGKRTGGSLTTTGINYDDSEDESINKLKVLAKESYRFVKPTGHAYIFCGRDRFIFELVYDIMSKAGWDTLMWPIVWVKGNSGQNNQPERWPSSAYEAILFARKLESKIVLQGRPDWVQCDKVSPSEKIHQAEKPVPLCKELISRVVIPGQKLYDPFIGSGAIIEAACEMKLFASGCELTVESYATALSRMTKWQEGK